MPLRKAIKVLLGLLLFQMLIFIPETVFAASAGLYADATTVYGTRDDIFW